MDDAEKCRANGWVVGTRLTGNEGYGDTIIEITAIGESKILAKKLSHNGITILGTENLWTLSLRDWKPIQEGNTNG